MTSTAYPTADDVFEETLPLVDTMPVYGPPVVLLVGPWVLFVLLLAGPFAVIATLVVLLAAAAALVGLIGAIVMVPFLLVRHLREHRAGHASASVPAAQPVA